MLESYRSEDSSYTEISEEGFASRIEKNILWFEIPVNDNRFLLMRVLKGAADLCEYRQSFFYR